MNELFKILLIMVLTGAYTLTIINPTRAGVIMLGIAMFFGGIYLREEIIAK